VRRKGEQTVRVEHVHVYPGGQAIVGNVNHPGGDGGIEQAGDQPDASCGDPKALALAPSSPVRSED
jgi:hypothetical protein